MVNHPAVNQSDEATASDYDQNYGMTDIEMAHPNKLDMPMNHSDGRPQSQHTHIAIPKPAHKNQPNSSTQDSEAVVDEQLLREVPAFCAICLKEYEVLDTVSWSSNSKCTHVFHKDCISSWFVTMLKKRVSIKTTNPAMVSTRLECPMCRQDFLQIQDRAST